MARAADPDTATSPLVDQSVNRPATDPGMNRHVSRPDSPGGSDGPHLELRWVKLDADFHR